MNVTMSFLKIPTLFLLPLMFWGDVKTCKYYNFPVVGVYIGNCKFVFVLCGGGDRVPKMKLVLFLRISLLHHFMTYPSDSTFWVLDAGCGWIICQGMMRGVTHKSHKTTLNIHIIQQNHPSVCVCGMFEKTSNSYTVSCLLQMNFQLCSNLVMIRIEDVQLSWLVRQRLVPPPQ